MFFNFGGIWGRGPEGMAAGCGLYLCAWELGGRGGGWAVGGGGCVGGERGEEWPELDEWEDGLRDWCLGLVEDLQQIKWERKWRESGGKVEGQ